MLLFSFFGPEIIVILFALGFLFLVIFLVIKLIGLLFKPKPVYRGRSTDKITQLERLASLKEKGLLTAIEYENEKRKLLR